MDQHETWNGGRLQPWSHCVRFSSPRPKGHSPLNFRPGRCCVRYEPISSQNWGTAAPTPLFGPYIVVKRLYGCLLCMIWYGGRPRPGRHCVRWWPNFPHPQKGGNSPQLSAHVCCGQMAGLIKIPLGTEVGIGPGFIVLDGDAGPPKQGAQPPIFGPCLLWPNSRPSGYCWPLFNEMALKSTHNSLQILLKTDR